MNNVDPVFINQIIILGPVVTHCSYISCFPLFVLYYCERLQQYKNFAKKPMMLCGCTVPIALHSGAS